MKIGLIDVDSKMPNLALMKISAWHKDQGDTVEWYNPLLSNYDKVYASKVFTFTPDYDYYPENTIKGGTGYVGRVSSDMEKKAVDTDKQRGVSLYGSANGRRTGDISQTLCEGVQNCCPDYDLYSCDHSIGFLTRGCPNKCEWCVVPDKEGAIRPEADIDDFLRHDTAVLLDNNVLAHEHGLKQIEKIARLGVKVDFNQGLDARLIDASKAKLLAKVKWLTPLRLACDSSKQIPSIDRAVKLLRTANVTPKRYNCYMLIKDVDEAYERAMFLKSINVDPFAQPYRDFENNTEPTRDQKDLARWINRKGEWRTQTWAQYKNRKKAKKDLTSSKGQLNLFT